MWKTSSYERERRGEGSMAFQEKLLLLTVGITWQKLQIGRPRPYLTYLVACPAHKT
jgi:hypothetical protein